MTRRGAVVAALCASTFAACGRGAPPPSAEPYPLTIRAAPELESITVTVPGDFRAGLARARAAFLAVGLAVDAPAEAGVVTTVPVSPDPRAPTPVNVVYRATVLHAGRRGADSARIVLSGEMSTEPEPGVPAQITAVTSRTPSYDAAHGSHGWIMLQAIASALR